MQTLVYVIHCQKTQMHLANLALRFHGQKLQRETWCPYRGREQELQPAQRYLNVTPCVSARQPRAPLLILGTAAGLC